ncbi:hypothetical protein HU200_047944 [Digitaria exilis]|uniref:Uncharacterized protein n=1 Tax=Digitaria exilis TaxID=1010633 RepID=A0A835E9S0_9POAL|nr:hypothetical protein HU200_047944 [Digitaria exilis]
MFALEFFKAHGTLLCGENGGGVPEMFGCENDIDVCLGSLSKGVGCQGGFVACRHLLRSGFLVQPTRPPVVPPNSSRFQILPFGS